VHTSFTFLKCGTRPAKYHPFDFHRLLPDRPIFPTWHTTVFTSHLEWVISYCHQMKIFAAPPSCYWRPFLRYNECLPHLKRTATTRNFGTIQGTALPRFPSN
jgi:hypothetical protein